MSPEIAAVASIGLAIAIVGAVIVLMAHGNRARTPSASKDSGGLSGAGADSDSSGGPDGSSGSACDGGGTE